MQSLYIFIHYISLSYHNDQNVNVLELALLAVSVSCLSAFAQNGYLLPYVGLHIVGKFGPNSEQFDCNQVGCNPRKAVLPLLRGISRGQLRRLRVVVHVGRFCYTIMVSFTKKILRTGLPMPRCGEIHMP